AALRHVARTGRGATDRARGLEAVRGTPRARPRAVLRHVARTGRGAAHRARGLEAVGGARRARPRAALRYVARTGRGAAHRVAGARRGATLGPGVAGGVATRPGAAGVGGTGVAVVGAARAVRLEGVRWTGRARGGERDELADLGRAGVWCT